MQLFEKNITENFLKSNYPINRKPLTLIIRHDLVFYGSSIEDIFNNW